MHVTFGLLQREEIFADRNVSPIGVPLPNTCVYVCDAYMNPQPIGVPGELYIGGTGVCREYLGRPDLTAARFVPSPFKAGERLYRSGDLGVWRADGTLAYLGRNDRQVQVRGYRVELDEIVAALETHPLVRKAVVALWQPPDDARELQKRIVAWVVRAAGEPAAALPDLRAHLRTTLPEFMVPTHLIDVEQLPLGPNGKVDVARLPVPHAPAGSAAAPDAGVAAQIAAIWRSVLRCGDVGLDDNFFDLGGHSLLLIEVHRLLVEWRGGEVPSSSSSATRRCVRSRSFERGAAARPAPVAPGRCCRRCHRDRRTRGRFLVLRHRAIWHNRARSRVRTFAWATMNYVLPALRSSLIALSAHCEQKKPVLAAIDAEFDADFFRHRGPWAAIIDPQHRLFLECAWERSRMPATIRAHMRVASASSRRQASIRTC